MKRFVLVILVLVVLTTTPAIAGLGAHSAEYVGGTVINVKEKTEGKIDIADAKILVFQTKGAKLTIPYDQIDSLEYGQKAGRRVGLAVAVSPLFLLSKKRRHYLTIGFVDENKKQQAAVFQLGKDIIQPTLSTLEARSGKKIEYQDEDARRSGGGAK